MEREKVEARLRKGKDDDLRQATASIDGGELSEIIRDGLRLMLGIRTKKTVQVVEQPIRQREVHFQGKPAVFIPKGGEKRGEG